MKKLNVVFTIHRISSESAELELDNNDAYHEILILDILIKIFIILNCNLAVICHDIVQCNFIFYVHEFMQHVQMEHLYVGVFLNKIK